MDGDAAAPLQADATEVTRFVDALFRYADAGTFVSLRSFHDDETKVFAIEAHSLTDDHSALVDCAVALATRAARSHRPVVFAPPIATFSNGQGAAEADLANGLALSVECDRAPAAAHARLEALLGPTTIVVASGGEWTDPETGEIQPKLHLHWRLDEPTRDPAGHAALKQARGIAQRLAGGDPSGTPAVHPMRWPGSWHRKAAPRLARIVAAADTEIDLRDALERLREAWGVAGSGTADPKGAGGSETPTGEDRETAELIRAILAGEDYHAPIAALAMRYLKGGMADAQVVLTLRGIMDAVPEAIRDLKDGATHTSRWQSRFDDIPRAVSTARARIGAGAVREATTALDVARFRLDGITAGPPPAQRYLLKPLMPLGTVGVLFGPGGVGKSITALELCLAVATQGAGGGLGGPLGSEVTNAAAGVSVFLTLEDDAAEVHRRTAALDPQGRREGAPCFVVPAVDLHDFEPALVRAEGRAAALTEFASAGLDRLLEDAARAAGRPVRLLVLDPAGDFLDADENDATFVKCLMRRLRAVAAHHGCTIVLLGHVAKAVDADGPSMRGSGAWVANSRFAYALWRPSQDEAAKLGRKHQLAPEALVWGSLVKANHAGAPVGLKRLFVRDSATGRLMDRTALLDDGRGKSDSELLETLVKVCAECAAAGLPFSYSGVAGLWSGKDDLPAPLSGLSKTRLERLGKRALETGLLVKARTTHTQGAPKYLDVRDGPLATGREVEMFQGSRQEALAKWRAGGAVR